LKFSPSLLKSELNKKPPFSLILEQQTDLYMVFFNCGI
jgi:hypothetical protein